MFKTLRDKLLGASKQAEEELDPQLNLDYETFRPEERDSGAVIRESHLDNVLWEMELALLQSDVAMEALEEMKEIIKKRLIGLRVENKAAIAPTIEKALKASLVELLSKSEFDSSKLLEKRDGPLIIAFVGVNGTGKTTKALDILPDNPIFAIALSLPSLVIENPINALSYAGFTSSLIVIYIFKKKVFYKKH